MQAAVQAPPTAERAVPLGGARLSLRRFLRHKLAVAGACIIAWLSLMALAGPAAYRVSPTAMDVMSILSPPSAAHPFGTDDFGRDVLSRVVHGTRLSLAVGASVLVLTSLAGTILGLVSGFFPRLDNVLMRVMDAVMAFPAILLALVIMAILGPRTVNVVIALAIVYTPRTARLVRGTVLAVRELDYVEAARALGATDWRIIGRYILPNCLAPVIVQGTFVFAYSILGEAGLSFIGVGTVPPTPSLGNILSDARPMLREAPWMALLPGGTIALAILGLNLLGDGLRDLLDPRARHGV